MAKSVKVTQSYLGFSVLWVWFVVVKEFKIYKYFIILGEKLVLRMCI